MTMTMGMDRRPLAPGDAGNSMVRDLSQPIAAAVIPDGLAITGYQPDMAEHARLIRNESLRDHWGSTETSPQSWAHFLASSAFRRDSASWPTRGPSRSAC